MDGAVKWPSPVHISRLVCQQPTLLYDSVPKSPYPIASIVASLKWLEDKRQEHFVLISLSGGRIINSTVIFIGTVNSMVVHPREIFAQAIADYATSIVIAHSHPSGIPSPSQDDIETTRQLVQAGVLLGIPVEDHIVIGQGSYFSFREQGLVVKT